MLSIPSTTTSQRLLCRARHAFSAHSRSLGGGCALSITEIRTHLAETVDEVHCTGERVPLEKHGKVVAALFPTEDLELLEALAESTERLPYDKLRAELGLA